MRRARYPMIARSRHNRYEAFHHRRSKLLIAKRTTNRKVDSAVAPPLDLISKDREARSRRRRKRGRRYGPRTPIRAPPDRPVYGGWTVGEPRRAIERLLARTNRFSLHAGRSRRSALLEGRRRRSARMVARRRSRIRRPATTLVPQTLVGDSRPATQTEVCAPPAKLKPCYIFSLTS
jgi:hypothetical protein